MALRPLWKCPKCGARFVTRNLWHSCGKHTIKELFSKSEPQVLKLFRKFEEMVRSCGRVTMIPQKTRVVFMVRVRFAGAYPRKNHLLCAFALPRKVSHPQLCKYEPYARHFQGHFFKIESQNQLDTRIRRWLKEAYGVGEQKYLRTRRGKN
mgnify:CR=1 FL=1